MEEAVEFLGAHGSSASTVQILAGGTDFIPSMRQKLFEPQYVLDLSGITAMRGISPRPDGGVEIGALTTLRAIERSSFLQQHYPVLTEAAATVASPVLRNMGTIGGNICLDTRCLWYNQSLTWRKGCGFCIKKDGDLCHVAPGGTKCWAVFSGDTPPALLCLSAEIEIANATGIRRVSLRDFYTGLGDNYRKLQPNELVTRIFLPASAADYQRCLSKTAGSRINRLSFGWRSRRDETIQRTRRRRKDRNHRGQSRATTRAGCQRDAGRQSRGRGFGRGRGRFSCEDSEAVDHLCVDARISSRDDSRFHQEGRARGS